MEISKIDHNHIKENKDNLPYMKELFYELINDYDNVPPVFEEEIVSMGYSSSPKEDAVRYISGEKLLRKREHIRLHIKNIFMRVPKLFSKQELIDILPLLQKIEFMDYDILGRIVARYKKEDIKDFLNHALPITYYNNPILDEQFLYYLITGLNRIDELDNDFLIYLLDSFNKICSIEYFRTYLDDSIEDLSHENQQTIKRYGIHPIFYLQEDEITQELIDEYLSNPNLIDKGTPSIISNKREYIKRMIKTYPESISRNDYILDEELRNIAVSNGYKYTKDDYDKYGFLDKELALALLTQYTKQYNIEKFSNGATLITSVPVPSNFSYSYIIELLNVIAKKGLLSPEIIQLLNDEVFYFPSLEKEEDTLEAYKELLKNKEICILLLQGMGNFLANNVEFEITPDYIEKFYECEYCLVPYSNENILSSQELYRAAFDTDDLIVIANTISYGKKEFLTKKLLNTALSKGYDPIVNNGLEITDPLLINDVENFINNLPDSDYKKQLKIITKTVGSTIVHLEKDNVISKEMLETFDLEFILKIIRNLIVPGKKMDFKSLIEQGNLEQFKNYYYTFRNSEDIRDFYHLYDRYQPNITLITELLNNGMTEEEKENFKQYIYQKDCLFSVSNKNNLTNIYTMLNKTNEQLLNEKIDSIDYDKKVTYLKVMIIGALFNLSRQEVESLMGIISVDKIKKLKSCINDEKMEGILSKYSVIMEYIEYINQLANVDILKEIAHKVNKVLVDEPDLVDTCRNITKDMELVAKSIYTYELNTSLSTLNNPNAITTKVPNSTVECIEYSEDSYFLAHVLNAFGSGSKLSDFKNPRFIGKTYICLTGIGEGIEPYYREEKDMNHVTILFNRVPAGALISMSPCDMASYGGSGSLDVSVRNNFHPFKTILEKTTGIPNEYVIYRETNNKVLYPSAILVVGETPSLEEIQAAEYLEVPLVKRTKVKRKDITGPTADIKTSETEELEELPKNLMELKTRLNFLKTDSYIQETVLS